MLLSIAAWAKGSNMTTTGDNGAGRFGIEFQVANRRAIVLEELDYLVDCLRQRLVARDPRFVSSEIETM
jgi:hypothetical protein